MPKRYDSTTLSVQTQRRHDDEALERVRAELRAEAKQVPVNKQLHLEAETSLVPDVHSLIGNAYHIIDTELRTLKSLSRNQYEGLDKNQAANFAAIVRSIQTLNNVEMTLRDQNALEALPDDELRKRASEAFLKLDKRLQKAITEEALKGGKGG
tara:strand:- start:31 stop:492 length:462 start_codon:yes stop_codon:yes gene_type:complete